MARELRRPGSAPGIEAVLRDQFEVRTKATLGVAAAAERVRAKIAAERLTCERLDLSDDPVRRGALFDMSGARVPFPPGRAYDRCYVALIDPDTRLGWGHDAHWAFVPADGEGDVVVQDTDLPEHALGPVRFHPVPRS
jgi:hypothetical protein